MSSSRAAPASAAFFAAPDRVVVTFDESCVDDVALDVPNWSVRYNNFIYTPTAAAVSGAALTVSLTQAGADAGADVVSYAPPPNDVVTLLSGLPVLAFTDFAIT